MDKLDHRELVLMRRAAEDACSAMNRRYEPFIEAVAKPLTIIALLDLVQSRQAEVDQLNEAIERQGKLAIQAMNEAHKGSRLELSIAQDIQASLKPELIESERQMNTQLTDENMRLEARIDAALKHANLNFWNAVTVGLMVKALRGEHE